MTTGSDQCWKWNEIACFPDCFGFLSTRLLQQTGTLTPSPPRFWSGWGCKNFNHNQLLVEIDYSDSIFFSSWTGKTAGWWFFRSFFLSKKFLILPLLTNSYCTFSLSAPFYQFFEFISPYFFATDLFGGRFSVECYAFITNFLTKAEFRAKCSRWNLSSKSSIKNLLISNHGPS